eukprot:427322-Amphidinium_carterae.1
MLRKLCVPSGFWLRRSLETDRKLGLVSSYRNLSKKTLSLKAWLSRSRRMRKLLMWKGRTKELLTTTLLPGVLIASGKLGKLKG